MSEPAPASVAFDAAAEDYDRTFTDTALGMRYRRAVWRRLDALVTPGQRVLELNCGTGADAVHLAARGVHVLATDIAPRMVALTARKAAGVLGAPADGTGTAGSVEARVLAIEDLRELETEPGAAPRFDAVLSNFGGLNCVADLRPVADTLARLVRSGGRVVLCVMGPFVPWEWAWFLGTRRPAQAVRRLRGPADWGGVTVHYRSVRAVRRAFAPAFVATRVAGLGAIAPLPEAAPWADRHPRLVDRLDRFERRVEAAPGVAWCADHFLLELQRR